ncbi:ABC transporter permease subunit [Bacteriovoracaceae bacterium]|nr:ABC transporter permease subunit [Bacteriovoracaceae bacterium]
MISLRNVKVVFKKEFLQIMRDKSVLFTNFFIPLFGIPLYFIIIIESITYMDKKESAPIRNNTVFTLSYQGDINKLLIEKLSSDSKIKLIKIDTSFTEKEIVDYREKSQEFSRIKTQNKKLRRDLSLKKSSSSDKRHVKDHNSKLVKAKNERFNALQVLKDKYSKSTNLHIAVFKNEENMFVTYFFHSKDDTVSKASLKYTKKIFKKYEDELVDSFKSKSKIEEYHLDPFRFLDIDLDKSSSTVMGAFGMALGGMIVFFLLISIFNPTINTTIGERDQNTYKVLLMNPLSLHEIFIGKYLNVALQGLLTLVPYTIEFIIFYAWGSSNYLFQNVPELTATKFLLVAMGTVAGSIFISSMCFLACSFAKTRVQAQSLITLLMFAVAIPIGTVGKLNIKLNAYTSMIPLINFPLSTENLMSNSPDYMSVMLAVLVNIVISMVIIWFSLGAFHVQWKGSSGSKSLNDLLSKKRRKSEFLVPAHAFLAFCIVYLGYAYGGIAVATFEIDLFSFLFAPILFCLGTSIFIVQYSGMDFTKIFEWKGLTFAYMLRLVAASFLLSLFFNLLMKNSVVSELFKVDFPTIFETNVFVTNVGYFLLFAVIPGFTEEILFRGIIFKGLRSQYSFMISMIVSSVLFAIIHFSMFKWGHTFAVGLFLAVIYEKRGLLSCILFHTLFNSFGLLFGLNESFSSLVTNSTTLQRSFFIPISLVLVYFLIVPKGIGKEEMMRDTIKEVA